MWGAGLKCVASICPCTEKFPFQSVKASVDSFLKFINTSWISVGQGTAKSNKKRYPDGARLCLDDKFLCLMWSGTYCTGWEAVCEWTKHFLSTLFGHLLDWIAFFIREMKELHSGMLPDRRNAAGAEFLFLHGTLAITHFDWLHYWKKKICDLLQARRWGVTRGPCLQWRAESEPAMEPTEASQGLGQFPGSYQKVLP